ncbi:MAG TPA: type VII secretion protein EccB [Pseudonocardiaceae bacterium]|jgi:type VII secretion protein EccB|nr:type VII secretion protein EccB [Pseudonocardiaceae bacterium]
MASTPTTKSQVQAYRFVIRRMESALVRKDPVMLHDPMRSHKRATVVGVIIAAVGLIAFAVVGLFSPSGQLPSSGIVIGAQSGQVYVVSKDPSELIPVFNVASARLLMMVENNKGNPLVPSPSSSSSSSSTSAPVAPVTVDDSELTNGNVPMGRLTGIPDGPQELPAPGSGNSNWAVCDQLPTDASASDQQPTTTVLAGESNIGTDLAQGQALLAQGPDNNQEYLIYDRTSNANNGEDDSTVAAPIESSDSRLMTALNLRSTQPRLISAALLGAIPQVTEISNPVQNLPGFGTAPSNYSLQGIKVGQSFAVTNASGPDSYYVALTDGVQSVTPTVAQIVLYENDENTFTRLSGFQVGIGNIKQVNELNVGSYPDSIPQIVDAGGHPVTCLGWTADTSNSLKPLVRTRVTIDTKLQLPTDPNTGSAMVTVPIGQASPDGEKVDDFFMNPSFQSIAVHAATNPAEFSTGPIYIVSGRGVKYSVEDETTAQGLGIANSGSSDGMSAAPESIMRLLPSSAETLSTENVMRTYDSVPLPTNAGLYMVPSSEANAPAGGN